MTPKTNPPESLDHPTANDHENDLEYIQNYWLKLDTWDLEDAILLLLGLDPHKKDFYLANTEIAKKFDVIYKVAFNCEGKSLSMEKNSIINREANIYIVNYRVNSIEFSQWAISKGYEFPQTQNKISIRQDQAGEYERPIHSQENNLEICSSKIDKRVLKIVKIANTFFEDPLNIPSGGKSKIGKYLQEEIPNLFTVSTFDQAWKKAKKEKLLQVENLEQYKKSK